MAVWGNFLTLSRVLTYLPKLEPEEAGVVRGLHYRLNEETKMLRTPLEAGRAERVALILRDHDTAVIAETLGRAGLIVSVHASAPAAVNAWRSAPANRPDCAVFSLATDGLIEAVRELAVSTELPVLLGVFGPGAMGDAVALLREGFYDCVPSPLSGDDALELCTDALAARRHYRTRSTTDGNALANVLTIAGERDLVAASEAAVALLALDNSPCRLVIGGKSYPGGSSYTPPAETWEKLGKTGRASLVRHDLPADFAAVSAALEASDDAVCAEAMLLAPGVLLLREGEGHPAPAFLERLVGAVLALVSESETFRGASLSADARARMERMALLGEASVTLNHDINNPLCAISLNAQLLSMALATPGDPKLLGRVQAIEEHTHKIHQIVSRLTVAKQEAERRAEAVLAGTH